MSTVTLAEAQAELPALVHRLTSGEKVSITENGSVVAQIEVGIWGRAGVWHYVSSSAVAKSFGSTHSTLAPAVSTSRIADCNAS